MKRIVLIAAATLALSAPAFARQPGAWQVGNDSFHLVYDDLDVSTRVGRAELLKRVEKVAKRACDLPLRADEQACVDSVIAGIAKPEIVQALAERGATRLAAR